MPWVAIVVGWPAAFASIMVSGGGLVLRRAAMVLAGAVIGLPFMAYLAGSPGVGMVAAAAVVCHFGAAVALWRRRVALAWVLFAPAPLLTFFVAAALLLSAR